MSTKKDNMAMAALYTEGSVAALGVQLSEGVEGSIDWDKEYYLKYNELPESREALQDFINSQTSNIHAKEDEEGGIISDEVKQQIRAYLDKKRAGAEAKNKGYQERGENSWIGVIDADSIMDDLERHNPGISSLDDYLNWEDYQTYYDVYKDYHGISPRWTSWQESDDWAGEIDALQSSFQEENERDDKERALAEEYFGPSKGGERAIPHEPTKKFKEFARAAGQQGLYGDRLPEFIEMRIDDEVVQEMESAWQDNYRVGQSSGSATPEFDNSIASAMKNTL